MNQQLDSTELMAQLLRLLRVEMNGAVTGAMQQRGAAYPLNYGVSVPTIRKIAAPYAPNHKLSRLLFCQRVRDLQLAAIYVADPMEVTVGELDFWAEGVVNTELAEHLSTMLLSRTLIVGDIVLRWLMENMNDDPKSDLLRYCALLCGARAIGRSEGAQWDWVQLIGVLPQVVSQHTSRHVIQGTATLIESLWRFKPESHRQIRELSSRLAQQGATALTDEIGWILEP